MFVHQANPTATEYVKISGLIRTTVVLVEEFVSPPTASMWEVCAIATVQHQHQQFVGIAVSTQTQTQTTVVGVEPFAQVERLVKAEVAFVHPDSLHVVEFVPTQTQTTQTVVVVARPVQMVVLVSPVLVVVQQDSNSVVQAAVKRV